MNDVRDRADVVGRSGVHVACLRRNDQRRRWVPGVNDLRQLLGAHAALVVGLDSLERGIPEAEHLQRDGRRDVGLRANDHAHGRRSLQALLLNIPAVLQQH
jgi:hypothetical protein